MKPEDISKVQILELLLTLPSAKEAYHQMMMAKALDLDPEAIIVAIRKVLHDHLNQKPEENSDKMQLKR